MFGSAACAFSALRMRIIDLGWDGKSTSGLTRKFWLDLGGVRQYGDRIIIVTNSPERFDLKKRDRGPLTQGFEFKALASLGIRVGNAGLSFIMFVVLARWLSTESFGAFGSMFAFGSALAFIVLGGQHVLVLRELSAQHSINDMAKTRWYLRIGLRFVLLTALALCLIVIIAVPWVMGGATEITRSIVIGGAVFMVPMAIAEILMAVLRAEGKIYWALIPRDIIWRLAVILLAGLGAIGALSSVSGLQAMVYISLMLGVLLAGQWGIAKNSLPAVLRNGAHLPQWKSWRVTSLWLWLASVAGNLSSHLSVVIVLAVLSVADAGAFFASQKIAMILALPLNAINIISAPEISRLYHAHDIDGLRSFLRRLMMLLIGPILLGFAVIALFGEWLLSLFDPDFVATYPVLLVLAAGLTVRSFCGPVGIVLLMIGRERMALFIFLATEGLALLAMPFLAIEFGMIGAAWAAFVGALGVSLVPVFWCRKNLGIDPSIGALIASPREGV